MTLAAILVMAASACDKEPGTEPPAEPENGTVRFTLEGACEYTDVPEGTIAATRQETAVEDLYALIFREGKWQECLELKDVNAEYSFGSTEGQYQMVLVANAGEYIATETERLEKDKSGTDALADVLIRSAQTENGGTAMMSTLISFGISGDKEENLARSPCTGLLSGSTY